jgi:hypothetical protein
MLIYYGATAIVTLILWVLSELKPNSNITTRILYGVATTVLVVLTIHSYTSLKQGYEQLYVRNSLHLIKEQINSGNPQTVVEAISKFEVNIQNQSFAGAASKLLTDCEVTHTNQPKKYSNKEDAPDPKAVR